MSGVGRVMGVLDGVEIVEGEGAALGVNGHPIVTSGTWSHSYPVPLGVATRLFPDYYGVSCLTCRCVSLLLEVEEWRQAADRPTSEPRSVGEFSAAAGTTPLMLAARAGSCAVIRLIVDMIGHHRLCLDRHDADGS